jgi:type VI secretion system secreted protein VgrG
MNYLTSKKFSFTSDAVSPDTFGVVKFEGTEGISKCYTFEITVVSDNLELDLQGVIENPAKLTFHRDEGDDAVYHGILLSFEQLHETNKLAFYRAHLVPRLAWLSFTQHNQVFLNKSVPEIIEGCLKDGGLTGADFEMRLQGSYDPVEYVCQYGESHLSFVSRWCEREGIYYFFEQSDAGEKVVFTDTRISHTPYSSGDTITYSPVSGLEAAHEKEIVKSFHCRMNLTPKNVLLKDYNYRKPSLNVSGNADVDAKGRGQVYSFGDHIRTPEEGDRIAKIKAEGLLCRKEVFHGEGSVPYMMPGYTFTLKDHYRGSFNQSYLVTDVGHEGNQTGYLLAGITTKTEDRGVFYRNSFSSIVADIQFRPEAITPKPRISGTLTAKIDAEGSGEYAEIDPQGRYKVILPFDISGLKDGKASAPLRMAQSYAGSNHGMHFPLHKGTEVLLTFIDGDPDRPIIQSAIPNPENPSPVNVNNQTMAAITTAGGNKIHIEDKTGTERILMHSPNQKSFIRIGAPNDPSVGGFWDDVWDQYVEKDEYNKVPYLNGIAMATHGALSIEVEAKNEVFLGLSNDVVTLFRLWFTAGMAINGVFGGRIDLHQPVYLSFKNLSHETKAEELETKIETFMATAEDARVGVQQAALVEEIKTDTIARCEAVHEKAKTVLNKHSDVGVQTTLTDFRAKAETVKVNNSVAQVGAIEKVVHDMGVQMRTTGQAIEQLNHTDATIGAAVETLGMGFEKTGDKTQVAATQLIH